MPGFCSTAVDDRQQQRRPVTPRPRQHACDSFIGSTSFVSNTIIGAAMQSFLHRVRLIRQCKKPLSFPRATVLYVLKPIRFGAQQRREFLNIPAVLVPPVVFGGLVIALWTWKCLMMVVFQNKIIYMPGLPPNARREKIEDYKGQCGGIKWREERIRSGDGTRISLCVASVTNGAEMSERMKTVYILYFQGSSLLSLYWS